MNICEENLFEELYFFALCSVSFDMALYSTCILSHNLVCVLVTVYRQKTFCQIFVELGFLFFGYFKFAKQKSFHKPLGDVFHLASFKAKL